MWSRRHQSWDQGFKLSIDSIYIFFDKTLVNCLKILTLNITFSLEIHLKRFPFPLCINIVIYRWKYLPKKVVHNYPLYS